MKYGDLLHYADDARSVHTVLRVTNEDNREDVADVLFDNLTSAVQFIAEHDLKIWQEVIGFANTPTAEQLGGGMTDDDRERPLEETITDPGATKRVAAEALSAWREHVSGPGDDALIIDCFGDPQLLRDSQSTAVGGQPPTSDQRRVRRALPVDPCSPTALRDARSRGGRVIHVDPDSRLRHVTASGAAETDGGACVSSGESAVVPADSRER